jgi:hypothetical protein
VVDTAPSSIQGLHLVVDDIHTARKELIERGVDVGGVQDITAPGRPAVTCCSPRRRRPVPDRVRRDLIDRDYEIIRPVRRPARPHRHAAQAAAARLAHRYVPDLGQAQLPAGQHLEPGVGGEPDGLPAVLIN